jgi:tripartite-type tricarboxylate transporter receptor subunit TctC
MLKVAPPDGSTILITPLAPFVTHPHVYPKLRYDPFKDFTPLAHIANIEFALAVPAALPARTLTDYIDLVKRDSKYANYSSAGAGAIPHFFGVAFARAANIDTTHIPYKGTARTDFCVHWRGGRCHRTAQGGESARARELRQSASSRDTRGAYVSRAGLRY